MKSYIENLLEEFGQDREDVGSVWELLYWAYMNEYPINSGEIRRMFTDLEQRMEGLNLAQNDQVIYLVSDICLAHEKAAFHAGLQVGWCLAEELAQGRGTDRNFGRIGEKL